MPSAAKGYPLVVTMADSFSIERRRLMRFLGAKVVLTPRAAKGYGMYVKTKELAEASDWFLARQFETDANAKIHENTTARELLADWVAALAALVLLEKTIPRGKDAARALGVILVGWGAWVLAGGVG